MRRWSAKASPFYQRYLWIHGFAETVDTEADAREALQALPVGPLPPFAPRTMAEASVGRAYLLAGRPDEALPWLARAAKSDAAPSSHPVAHTRAQLWLGLAREAAHDKAVRLRGLPRGAGPLGQGEAAQRDRREGGGAVEGAELRRLAC